jgi:hypothetical protein
LHLFQLLSRAKVPNLDEAKFADMARDAEKNCPVSKVLNAEIVLGQAGLTARAHLCIAAKAARSCPLWVRSGHHGSPDECPLYPPKRTLSDTTGMSALCQSRLNAPQQKHRFSTQSDADQLHPN